VTDREHLNLIDDEAVIEFNAVCHAGGASRRIFPLPAGSGHPLYPQALGGWPPHGCTGGNIKKPLVGFRVLQYGCAFALLELFHKSQCSATFYRSTFLDAVRNDGPVSKKWML
jgi:hypothetical protein